MGFVTNISDFGSLAIVGLEKNTGKTECLNYILGQLGGQAERFALTSVGIDGEPGSGVPDGEARDRDSRGNDLRHLGETLPGKTARGRGPRRESGADGARAADNGPREDERQIAALRPSDTAGLKALIDRLKARGVGTTIVDGALSRLSLASPAVTEAMILATELPSREIFPNWSARRNTFTN